MKKEELNNLFRLNVKAEAPAFIVYSSQITERLNYTCDFIFKSVLNCTYSITNSIQDFQNSKALKVNYSSEPIPETFQVLPHALIFETGVNDGYVPESRSSAKHLYFHPNPNTCSLGHDIFASVFYFISRYQEWQPFDKDLHGRFEAASSIQFQLKQHLKPLVNLWLNEFAGKLCAFYPNLKLPQKKFQYISTIDVDNLYAYKKKGLFRIAAATARDVFTLNIKNVARRISVLSKHSEDPFDVYGRLNSLSKKNQIPLIYFFLQRGNTKYDRTIDPKKGAFEPLFKTLITEGFAFGLHPSYFTESDKHLMRSEFALIQKSAAQPINISRQHYLRFNIRSTPYQLIENNVMADFTMGFASTPGYRAGTFTPFYFYDFKQEKQSNLLMVPFAVMDGAYFVYSHSSPSKALAQMLEMAKEARELNGLFISVFHERTFDEVLCPGFSELYNELNERLK